MRSSKLSKRDVCPRINRWCLTLQEFKYKLEHRKAELMRHVDALSQYPVDVVEENLIETIKSYKRAIRRFN